jgi:hypothetical protein
MIRYISLYDIEMRKHRKTRRRKGRKTMRRSRKRGGHPNNLQPMSVKVMSQKEWEIDENIRNLSDKISKTIEPLQVKKLQEKLRKLEKERNDLENTSNGTVYSPISLNEIRNNHFNVKKSPTNEDHNAHMLLYGLSRRIEKQEKQARKQQAQTELLKYQQSNRQSPHNALINQQRKDALAHRFK